MLASSHCFSQDGKGVFDNLKPIIPSGYNILTSTKMKDTLSAALIPELYVQLDTALYISGMIYISQKGTNNFGTHFLSKGSRIGGILLLCGSKSIISFENIKYNTKNNPTVRTLHKTLYFK